METEVSIVSCGLRFSGSVNVDDSPSLVKFVVSSIDDNLLAFSIFSSSNIKNLLVLDVLEVLSSV
jgi:pantothenate kinase